MIKYRKQIVISLFVIVIVWYLLDKLSNGFVLDYIANNFTNVYEYTDAQGILHQVSKPDWENIKFYTLILTALLTAGCVYLIKYNADKKSKSDKADLIHQLEMELTAFRDGKEYLQMSEELAPIDSLLMQIRNKEDKQIQTIEKQTQQKNDLISYLAHDMKTPLASVIGYLSLLHDVKDIPKEQNDAYIQIALDKANRLESLIDEFFDITRFNLHDIVISRGKIQMRFLFEQLREQFYPIMLKQHKEIILDMPEDLVYYGDGDKLARAFNNILKNAISYSYEETKIFIECHQDEHTLTLYFHNQGDEIPKQKLDMIFEKFYRLDKVEDLVERFVRGDKSRNTEGSGLGLAIAKEIVEAHDGTIRAESSMKETVFIVTLPMKI